MVRETNAQSNGGGNGGNANAIMQGTVPAAFVLALLGTIFGVVINGFATDRVEQWDAIRRLEQSLRSFSEGENSQSALVERIRHVETLATTNKERIETAYRELDEKLQRELNLADGKLLTQIENLDHRLQSEIANNSHAIISTDEAIREIRAQAWTKQDHFEFEHRAGITLNWPDSSRTPPQEVRR